MLNGTHLTLMIGPAVPVPAPPPVLEALQSVQVNVTGARSGFQLTFNVGKNSLLQQVLLPAGFFDPMIARVAILVTMNGMLHVLMDGMVTRQEMAPSNEPGQSTLTVTGEDLSVLMDVVEMKIPYPAMPDAARVATILAKYATFGLVPGVVPPPVITASSPTTRIPMQTGTDLSYVKGLAGQCGYVFYIEPGPAPLTSLAYFGPDIRIPVPQPALNVNLDAETNVESLSFSFDGLAKKLDVVTILDPATRKIPIPIPVPPVNPLHPPLGARPALPAKVRFTQDMSKLPPDEAAKRIFGLMMETPDTITANGTLNVSRYGFILRARMLVGVRGAGLAYDGLYYVNSVTHNIKRGEYKQAFTLSRDGLVSQTPVVVP